MVVFPAVMPETTPVDEFTVATAVFADDHVPPPTGCDNVVVEPAQKVVVPVMLAGEFSIVRSRVVLQPTPETLYVIMVVPVPTEVISPVVELMVATAGLPLVQVPPAVAFVQVAVLPMQITSAPVGAAGGVFTVIVFSRWQPLLPTYSAVAVPAVSPTTEPVVPFIVNMLISLLLHVPPVVVLVSVQLAPSHTTELPDMVAGSVFTVM
jgi:hypothetical protein